VRLDQGHKHPGVDLDQRRPPRASGGLRVISLGRGHATDNSSSHGSGICVGAFKLLRMYDDGNTGCASTSLGGHVQGGAV
jgi:hypothetical protein